MKTKAQVDRFQSKLVRAVPHLAICSPPGYFLVGAMRTKYKAQSSRRTTYVLASETMNDEQAKWIGDGLEMVVGILGMLEEEHPRN